MNNTNKSSYWFFLEPYTYCSVQDKTSLLYNTLDGKYIKYDNPLIANLLNQLYDPQNGGAILLTEKDIINDPLIETFIKDIRKFYMGDIINSAYSTTKPIQLVPIYNLLSNVKEIDKSERKKGQNVLNYLKYVKINLVSHDKKDELEPEELAQILSKLPSNISISFYNYWAHSMLNDIKTIIEQHEYISKTICCNYNDITEEKQSEMLQAKYELIANLPLDESKLNYIVKTLSSANYNFNILFNVTSITELADIEQIINQQTLTNYSIKPIYTGNNLLFFEEYVYVDHSDILETPISMNQIFAHQTLNTNDFGKIVIMPNQDVYSNINHPSIGNLKTHSLTEILFNEMDNGKSWLHIRDHKPCSKCIYQWLCPSPSEYEIMIGKYNLCNIVQ